MPVLIDLLPSPSSHSPRRGCFAGAAAQSCRINRAWILAAATALIVALSVAPALAKKHPVPLEPGTDSATCVTCHEAKSKGTAVHSAMAMGCRTCHDVRVNREVTRVRLTATTSTKLCLSCHADKSTATLKGRAHAPTVRNCTQCHDPHASENSNQLLKPLAGDAGANLCLNCHTTGVKAPEGGSRHAALDMGCATCHVTHKTGDGITPEFQYHLTKSSPALCLDCHDATDAELAKAHQQQPIAGADCMTCHDPHQSSAPKLLQRFVHQPFGDRACDACHQPAENNKVVLTQPDSRALCVMCHEETAKKIESAAVPHAGAMGDCTTCHNPHAGKTPGFARPDPVNACLACHADQAELRSKKVLHQPAFQDGCAVCHEPHGGEKPKLLRAEGSTLCMNCHSTEIQPQPVKGAPLVTVFGGQVRLPENYFRKVPRLRLRNGMGHPTANHPVTDYADPLDPKKITKIDCMTCHQPHAGGADGMLVKDQRPTVQFCRTCHQGMIGAR
jgi:predicted CXXCH cytochrome family protein